MRRSFDIPSDLQRTCPGTGTGERLSVRTVALTHGDLLENEQRIKQEGEAKLRHAARLRASTASGGQSAHASWVRELLELQDLEIESRP